MIDRAPEVRRLHALVIKLVNLYYHTLWGHHKSRDCYFHIDICFTAFKPEATFNAAHEGYLNEFDVDCNGLLDAYRKMVFHVSEAIKNNVTNVDPDENVSVEERNKVMEALRGLLGEV